MTTITKAPEDEIQRDVDELMASFRAENGNRPNPLLLGRAFIRLRTRWGLKQTALAEHCGMTAGAVCHYESLVTSLDPSLHAAVEDGRLTFKVARALATIDSPSRQLEIARPFESGRLSSVYVEAVVRIAKSRPLLNVAAVIELALIERHPAGRSREYRQPAGRVDGPLHTLDQRELLQMAGRIDEGSMTAPPGYAAFAVLRALEVLRTKTEAAIKSVGARCRS